MRAGVLEIGQKAWGNWVDPDIAVARLRKGAALLAASLRAHAIFFVLIGIYIAGFFYAQSLTGTHVDMGLSWIVRCLVGLIIPTTLLSILIMRFMHMVYFVRPKTSPTVYLAKDMGRFLSSPARWLNAAPMIAVLIYFVLCFSTIKELVPVLNPFSWDMTFMELDRSLHFGMDPWRILQPVLGYAPITFLLNIVYNLWFVVVWMAFVWMAFATRQSELRLQYLLAYILGWSIGGSLLAVVFSSAGPVYYGNLGLGTDPYAPLMSYLNETSKTIPLWALDTQKMLWESYINNGKGLVSGISAMPSMHNVAAMTVALLGWKINRKAGIAGSLFAFAIFLGSIHLGWHYAVDAYFGFAIAGLCWWVSGLLARWYMQLSFVKQHAQNLEELA